MDSFDFGRDTILGVVIDVSTAKYNKTPALSEVQTALAAYAIKRSNDLRLLLSHPENIAVPKNPGGGLAQISHYRQDPEFDILRSARHLSKILFGCLEDVEKKSLIVTDRCGDLKKLSMAVNAHSCGGLGKNIPVVVVAIGKLFRNDKLKNLCAEKCLCHSIDSPAQLSEILETI
jgi:hypothetical protein